MTAIGPFPEQNPQRLAIQHANFADESESVKALLSAADLGEAARQRVADHATRLVEQIRSDKASHGGLDAFMHEYDLSNQEGVLLMCLAEALLRVPDAATADKLIADKIGGADWQRHLGHGESLFVSASTWALMLTGRLVRMEAATLGDAWRIVRRLAARTGEPVIRQAMRRAMRIMSRQFVMGRTIDEALIRARDHEARGYLHSYDMLGEAALTTADAERHYRSYADAIAAVGRASGGRGPVAGPGISIKLSALHPRFEYAQRDRVMNEMMPRVKALAVQAKAQNIGVCVDTEEADRLEITLDVIEAVYRDPALEGWEGFGFAVQAYQKRAIRVLDWSSALAREHRRRITVRLVKGAYWDAEIKRAQELGLPNYPVFTRKANTDLSYIACARKMLAAPDAFYPQFATHNAHTLAAVLEMAGHQPAVEFQRLHGMGEALYAKAAGSGGSGLRCRIYAPVGSHEDLLAYLVRRLLENGANTSFVNRLTDEKAPISEIVADPVRRVAALKSKAHPRIPLPPMLYGKERRGALGVDLTDPLTLRRLQAEMDTVERSWTAAPWVGGKRIAGTGYAREIKNPADRGGTVGWARDADEADADAAVAAAHAAAASWSGTPVDRRATCLEAMAAGMEEAMPELLQLCILEAGKTVADAVAEVREAVDFCRYYAARGRADFASKVLGGPAGESNRLTLHGRGVFVCISPWNFPLAIFCGQVAAALVAGNTVVAKPAEQTPLVAARAVELFHAAGIPADVLNLVPGNGSVGAALVRNPGIAGVAFTGSVAAAHAIQRELAAKHGPIAPLIAETGGQNVMLVDSTALPEQVIADAVTSAFRSAGQRCSALRVLFVQEDIANRIETMLIGAMAELRVGNPALLATDVGPVIDSEALRALEQHIGRMDGKARLLGRTPLSDECKHGTFLAPHAYAIDRLDQLEGEVFGPVLHVISYAASRLDEVLDSINATGYGLTLGIHSRVDGFVRHIHQRLKVGNTYVNRTMIGALVGVQPFGGEGLSGTGPKAGGPHYLHRFATERTLTINTAATGGTAELLSLRDEEDHEDEHNDGVT
jgi:RHH-type transcriptional regulator, proline utilization regulon repressor / proline dehydrogenase / delta 1-pyrroline-5-carboxylate dehydrogenase